MSEQETKWILGVAVASLMCLLTASSVSAQVIFLPTWHQFSYSGSVVVPDHGSMVMGANRYRRSSRTSYGVPGFSKLPVVRPLFRNSNATSESSVASAAVHATVIDLAAMDAAIMAQGGHRTQEEIKFQQGTAIQSRLAEIRTGGHADAAGTLSLAEIRRMRAAAKSGSRETTSQSSQRR